MGDFFETQPFHGRHDLKNPIFIDVRESLELFEQAMEVRRNLLGIRHPKIYKPSLSPQFFREKKSWMTQENILSCAQEILI